MLCMNMTRLSNRIFDQTYSTTWSMCPCSSVPSRSFDPSSSVFARCRLFSPSAFAIPCPRPEKEGELRAIRGNNPKQRHLIHTCCLMTSSQDLTISAAKPIASGTPAIGAAVWANPIAIPRCCNVPLSMLHV